MLKIIRSSIVFIASLLAAAGLHAQTLTIAASAIPHAEILEFIKPQLRAQGVDLRVKVFTDYVQPNLQVEERQLDANFFQHKPYLDAFNREHGLDITILQGSIGRIKDEPYAQLTVSVSGDCEERLRHFFDSLALREVHSERLS